MSWQDEMNTAIMSYLGLEGTLISMTDDATTGYGCPTCGPDMELSVDIIYEDVNGDRHYYCYNDGLAALIRGIT